MRKKLVDAADKAFEPDVLETDSQGSLQVVWNADDVVDAILDAMMQPSEEMLREGRMAIGNAYPEDEERDAWQAMIRAVKEG